MTTAPTQTLGPAQPVADPAARTQRLPRTREREQATHELYLSFTLHGRERDLDRLGTAITAAVAREAGGIAVVRSKYAVIGPVRTPGGGR